jgi:hypothetical protein
MLSELAQEYEEIYVFLGEDDEEREVLANRIPPIPTINMSSGLAQAYEMFRLSWFEIYVGLGEDDEEREDLYRICLETARTFLLAEGFYMNLYFSPEHMNKLFEHLELSRAELLNTMLTFEEMAQVDFLRSYLWGYEDYEYEF